MVGSPHDTPRSQLRGTVHLNDRSIRKTLVPTVDIKTFHERPVELRHEFKDEFPPGGRTLDVLRASTVVAQFYTLIDRKVSWFREGTWVWEYNATNQDEIESNLLNEEGSQESFTPLPPRVFHALWERYHGGVHRTRPPELPTKGEKEAAFREESLKAYPRGTNIRGAVADFRGRKKIFVGEVYDVRDPYWRVRYPDGDD